MNKYNFRVAKIIYYNYVLPDQKLIILIHSLNNVTLSVGAANLFDVYPTVQDTETETGGLWDAVQMGFSGRFLYSRLMINF